MRKGNQALGGHDRCRKQSTRRHFDDKGMDDGEEN